MCSYSERWFTSAHWVLKISVGIERKEKGEGNLYVSDSVEMLSVAGTKKHTTGFVLH